jgi:hypothetical protein
VIRLLSVLLTLLYAALLGRAAEMLSHDELAMLKDPGGWEYLVINDPNNGFKTQAACFDAQRTGACEGKLFFNADGSFTQTITAEGKSMHRGGTYKLDGRDVTFFDEHGTSDGPYTLKVDTQARTLVVDATRAGVGVHMELLLEKEFKKRLEKKRAETGGEAAGRF